MFRKNECLCCLTLTPPPNMHADIVSHKLTVLRNSQARLSLRQQPSRILPSTLRVTIGILAHKLLSFLFFPSFIDSGVALSSPLRCNCSDLCECTDRGICQHPGRSRGSSSGCTLHPAARSRPCRAGSLSSVGLCRRCSSSRTLQTHQEEVRECV